MPLHAGHLFGNYRIPRLLGEGGFGEVYLAENPLIERRAAAKVGYSRNGFSRTRSTSIGFDKMASPCRANHSGSSVVA
jgi:hypothetical protein